MLVMQRPSVEVLGEVVSDGNGERQQFVIEPLEPGFGHEKKDRPGVMERNLECSRIELLHELGKRLLCWALPERCRRLATIFRG